MKEKKGEHIVGFLFLKKKTRGGGGFTPFFLQVSVFFFFLENTYYAHAPHFLKGNEKIFGGGAPEHSPPIACLRPMPFVPIQCYRQPFPPARGATKMISFA